MRDLEGHHVGFPGPDQLLSSAAVDHTVGHWNGVVPAMHWDQHRSFTGKQDAPITAETGSTAWLRDAHWCLRRYMSLITPDKGRGVLSMSITQLQMKFSGKPKFLKMKSDESVCNFHFNFPLRIRYTVYGITGHGPWFVRLFPCV